MKALTTLLSLLIAGSVLASTEVPDSIPIGNDGALKAHLLEQALTGYAKAWFSGDGIAPVNGRPSVAHVTGGTPNIMGLNLGTQDIVMGITDPTKPITAHAVLYDVNNRPLFKASDQARIQNGSEIVLDKPLRWRLADYVPLYLGDAIDKADLILLDHDHTVRHTESLAISEDKRIMFPSWYIQNQGVVRITLLDGTVVDYSLVDGLRIEQPSELAASAVITEHAELTDDGHDPSVPLIWAIDVDFYEGLAPSTPTFIVTCATERTVRLGVRLHNKVIPTETLVPASSATYFKVGDDSEYTVQAVESPPNVNFATLEVTLSPGTYVFRWDDHVGLFGNKHWFGGGKG